MKFTVIIREFEAGWGNRVDEIKEFDDLTEAKDFVTRFNSHNTEETVLVWYMVAEGPYPKM